MGSINMAYAPNQPYNHDDQYQYQPSMLQPAGLEDDNITLKLATRPFPLGTQKYGNPDFLRALSLTGLKPIEYTSKKYSWAYNSRHKGQSTVPYLFLGTDAVARDSKFIAENNITMVVAVRSAQSAQRRPQWMDPAIFPACKLLETTTFDVDSPFDLIQRIQPILKAMTDHLEVKNIGQNLETEDDVKGRILVFCESGNERSPVLVAAYLMLVYGLTWHEGLNYLHAFRFSVSLSGIMNEMLKTWEGIIKAECDIAAATRDRTDTSTGNRKAKRSIDDAYDSDDTMTDESEVVVRLGVSPFVDAT